MEEVSGLLWVSRLLVTGVVACAGVFFSNGSFYELLGDLPNVPARGDLPKWVNMGIIFLAVFSTLFLITWVVENARLCERSDCSFVREIQADGM